MRGLLRLMRRPAPQAPDVDGLRRAWERLYDTEQGSAREQAAYRAYQLASVDLGRAA